MERTSPLFIDQIIQSVIFLFGCCILIILVSCTRRLPEPAMPQESVAGTPAISIDPETGENYIDIDILTYNVAALPWPISRSRGKALHLIAAEFAAMRARGEEPDLVFIQEGFIGSVKEIMKTGGYRNWARGPKIGDKSPDFSPRASEEFKKNRRFWKGERTGKIVDSGLYILSNFTIIKKYSQPFYRYECAGYDCGSNKGIVGIVVKIPGMPGHLELFNTHLNSRGRSTGVSDERGFEAQRLQLHMLDDVLDEHWDGKYPVVFGGDFNVKQARDTLNFITGPRGREVEKPAFIVQHYCTVLDPRCEYRVEHVSDEPWLETHNWQGWYPGSFVHIRALFVDEIFDKIYPEAPKIDGQRTLSDHNGVLVRYRLSWDPQEAINEQ